MSTFRLLSFLLILTVLTRPSLAAQSQSDVDAVHQVLDSYTELEESMDMLAQARLMSEDRVWIGAGAGRVTNQAKNMQIQAAQFDRDQQAALQGLKLFVDDRDRLVRFYGGGRVAVASFYRYMTYILPSDAPPELSEALAETQPTMFTLVLEKRDGEWMIVHTHVSNLIPPEGG